MKIIHNDQDKPIEKRTAVIADDHLIVIKPQPEQAIIKTGRKEVYNPQNTNVVYTPAPGTQGFAGKRVLKATDKIFILNLSTAVMLEASDEDFDLGTPKIEADGSVTYPDKILMVKEDHMYQMAPNRGVAVARLKKRMSKGLKKGARMSPF